MAKKMELKINAGLGDRLSTIRSIAVELAWAVKDAHPGSKIEYVTEVDGTLGNIVAVSKGLADVGISFPLGARWAFEDRFEVTQGELKGKMKNLRALACMAHLSWYPFAVRADSGISSVEGIKAKKFPLRILTTPVMDETSYSAAVIKQIFEAYGLSAESIRAWGGEVLNRGWKECQALKDGKANASLHELPPWGPKLIDLAAACDLRFLPLSDEAVRYLHDKYGHGRAIIPKGFWRGVEEDTQTIGRFNVLFAVREDMHDETAYELARLIKEVVSLRVPKHIPGGYLATHTPDYVCTGTGIPLHPGAEKYYREAGLNPTLEVPTDPEFWRDRFDKYAGGF